MPTDCQIRIYAKIIICKCQADWKFEFMRRQVILRHNKLFFAAFLDKKLETLNV